MASPSPSPFKTTAQPWAASALAMPSPMPLVDPVTIATLPASGRPGAARLRRVLARGAAIVLAMVFSFRQERSCSTIFPRCGLSGRGCYDHIQYQEVLKIRTSREKARGRAAGAFRHAAPPLLSG